MSKNEDYMKDARTILDSYAFSNKASVALARQAETFYYMDLGKFAFDYAKTAKFMEVDLPELLSSN